MKVFISHSSKDTNVAEPLIELLQVSLSLKPENIRCSSVNGYRLRVGALTDETLRAEVHDAKLFFGLITPNSIESVYVLFELGARWGAGKPLIPILAAGATSDHLKGPLGGISVLDCSDSGQIHQLIDEAASNLGISPNSPSAYQRHIEKLASVSAGVAAAELKQLPKYEATALTATSTPFSKYELELLSLLADDQHLNEFGNIEVSTLLQISGLKKVYFDVAFSKLDVENLIRSQFDEGDDNVIASLVTGLTHKGKQVVVDYGLA